MSKDSGCQSDPPPSLRSLAMGTSGVGGHSSMSSSSWSGSGDVGLDADRDRRSHLLHILESAATISAPVPSTGNAHDDGRSTGTARSSSNHPLANRRDDAYAAAAEDDDRPPRQQLRAGTLGRLARSASSASADADGYHSQ